MSDDVVLCALWRFSRFGFGGFLVASYFPFFS